MIENSPYNDLPKDKLEEIWYKTEKILRTHPADWDTLTLQVLIDNEYNRRDWPLPRKPWQIYFEGGKFYFQAWSEGAGVTTFGPYDSQEKADLDLTQADACWE